MSSKLDQIIATRQGDSFTLGLVVNQHLPDPPMPCTPTLHPDPGANCFVWDTDSPENFRHTVTSEGVNFDEFQGEFPEIDALYSAGAGRRKVGGIIVKSQQFQAGVPGNAALSHEMEITEFLLHRSTGSLCTLMITLSPVNGAPNVYDFSSAQVLESPSGVSCLIVYVSPGTTATPIVITSEVNFDSSSIENPLEIILWDTNLSPQINWASDIWSVARTYPCM